VAEHLRRYPGSGNELVFTSPEHKPINRNHFNRYTWRPALNAAGIERSRRNGMHALRHFCASCSSTPAIPSAVADYSATLIPASPSASTPTSSRPPRSERGRPSTGPWSTA
jgi:integrase